MNAIYVILVGVAVIPVLISLFAGIGWLLADASYIRDWGDYAAEGFMAAVFGLMVLGVIAIFGYAIGAAVIALGEHLSWWQTGWLQ